MQVNRSTILHTQSTDIDLMCLYLKMRILRLEAIPCPLVPCYIQLHLATSPWGTSAVLGDINVAHC